MIEENCKFTEERRNTRLKKNARKYLDVERGEKVREWGEREEEREAWGREEGERGLKQIE